MYNNFYGKWNGNGFCVESHAEKRIKESESRSKAQ